MANVFLFRMPVGVPGTLTRTGSGITVDAAALDGTNYPTSFGVPVVIDATSKQLRKVGAGDTAALVKGFYVRPFVTQTTGTDGLGTSTAPVSGIGNIMRRGFMIVKLNGATASAKGGQVYVRTATGTGSVIGGIEAAADSTNTFALTGAFFTGTADASGNVEIEFNL